MRVGTWNLEGRWEPDHLELLAALSDHDAYTAAWAFTSTRAIAACFAFDRAHVPFLY